MGHPTLSACKESHFKRAKKKKIHLQILILSVENNMKGKRVLVDSSTQLILINNKDSRQVALVTSVTVQKWWPRCSPPLHWTLLSLRRTCRNGNNSTSIF